MSAVAKWADPASFDILTPESCYWVGFILADGNVTTVKSGYTTGILEVKLAECDSGHLWALKRFLKSESNVGSYWKRTNIGRFRQSVLRVTNRPIVHRLIELGVEPRKTQAERAHVSLERNRDFWRGVIDGDGSVFMSRNYPQIGVTGSLDLMRQFVAFVTGELGDVFPLRNVATKNRVERGIYRESKSADSYCSKLNGLAAKALIHLLYTDCSVALDRKLRSASECLAWSPRLVKARYRHLLGPMSGQSE